MIIDNFKFYHIKLSKEFSSILYIQTLSLIQISGCNDLFNQPCPLRWNTLSGDLFDALHNTALTLKIEIKFAWVDTRNKTKKYAICNLSFAHYGLF